MSDHDQIDLTDAELEALLGATFASEARARVSDARPVPPFPATTRLATVHPLRRRWVGLSVVAASLVAVAVAATIVGSEAMTSEKAPTPAGTSVAPPPTVATSPAAPTAPPTTAAATTSAASTAPAPTTQQVTYAGVTLTVPTTWNLLTDAPGAPKDPLPEACFSTGRTWQITGTGTDTCELRVQIGVYADSGLDIDLPGLYGQGGSICGSASGQAERTVTADEAQVDGWIAEHRVFTADCLSGTLQQWAVPTAPLVYFSRATGRADPDGDAAAAAAVRSAVLPGPRSQERIFDRGLVDSVTTTSLRLNRQVLRVGGDTETTGPIVDYPVAPGVVITYTQVGSTGFSTTLSVDTLRELLAGVARGLPNGRTVPALTSATARITTDGSQVTAIDYVDVT